MTPQYALTAAAALAGSVRRAAPAACRFVGGAIAVADGDLLPEERRCVARATPKRRAEFRAGRCYARQALVALGASPGPIPAAENRAPVWPQGVVGAISHCAGYAGAVVAPATALGGVGFDLERPVPMPDRLVATVARPMELAAPRPAAWDDPQRLARLLFAVRESVFKAYAPATGTYLGLHDVVVTLDWESGGFTCAVERPPARDGPRAVVGAFGVDGLIWALAWLDTAI